MAFTEEQKQAIHDNLYNALKGYASIQDINYAASRIIEDPSPENLDRVRDGLIAVSAPTASGIITPDNQIKNIIKNELIYLQSETNEQAEEFEDTNLDNIKESMPIGSIVTFGVIDHESETKTPLQWYVLDNTYHDKIKLICAETIWASNGRVTTILPWNESIPAVYLNEHFYNEAFSDEEKKSIIDEVDSNGVADHVRMITKSEKDYIVSNKSKYPEMAALNVTEYTRAKYTSVSTNSYSFAAGSASSIDTNKTVNLDRIGSYNPSTGGGTESSVQNTATAPIISVRPVIYVSLWAFFNE